MADRLVIDPATLDIWTADASIKLPTIANVSNIHLLRALCMQESRYGEWPVPRHENGWCPNSQPRQWDLTHQIAVTRHQKWGCLACCSYGPLQALYHSLADADLCADPSPLYSLRLSFDLAVTLLRRKILRDGCKSVAEVADSWNSGTSRDRFVPVDYVNAVRTHYETQLRRTHDA